MWWLFRKKNSIKEVKEDLEKIKSSLKNSFNYVRRDITHIKSRVNNHDMLIMELNNLTQELQQEQPKDIKKELNLEEIKASPSEINLLDLTNLQKSILLRLKLLSKETDQEWIAMKFLAQDLYPNKDYNVIKSMVSSYTDTLLQLNLLQKKRKGREIHLALTEKTYDILPKKEIKIKNKRK